MDGRRNAPGGIAGLAAALAAICAGLAGCAKPLLSPSDERTQFDRYDGLRNQRPPQSIEDEFGRRQPNLRARLSPRG